MKKWLVVILTLVILAFVFADSLFFLAGRWQEKTGKVKRAVWTYSRLIKRYPRSKWASRAKEAIERLEKSKGKRKREETRIRDPITPYAGVLKKTGKKVKDMEDEKEKEYEKWIKEIEK